MVEGQPNRTILQVGVQTALFGFSPTSTATSGSFPILDANDAGVTFYVGGHAVAGGGGTVSFGMSGNYSCTATGLTIGWSPVGGTIVMKLVPKP
jgi:hypothetical protein